MSLTNYFPSTVLLLAVALTLSACDSTSPGSVAAEPIAAAALEIPLDPGSLLGNGGFEFPIDGAYWRSCSSAVDFSTDAIPSEGDGALSVANGTCLSQSTEVTAGTTYKLSCEARSGGSGDSSISFGYVDDDGLPLESQENAITSAEYSTITSTITAPPGSALAEVLIYSDGEVVVDNCSVTRLPDAELLNGDFSSDLKEWFVCDGTDGDVDIIDGTADASDKQLSLSNGGCIFQIVDLEDVITSRPGRLLINLTCDVVTDESGYASIALGYRDGSFQRISNNVENVIGRTTDGVFNSDLEAPSDTQYAEIMLYSTSLTTIDNCSLSH